MSKRAISLADLPPSLRAQAERQMSASIGPLAKAKNGVAATAGPFVHPAEMESRRASRRMNKWESAYAEHLRLRTLAGEDLRWRFEPLRLRIGLGAFYKPDFMVTFLNEFGKPFRVEMHEVKGFWREAARVRIKVAADLFSEFVFVAVTRKGGDWREERF